MPEKRPDAATKTALPPHPTIATPAEYFAALEELGSLSASQMDQLTDKQRRKLREMIQDHPLEKAVRDYLLNLSPMRRQQLAVHAPNASLRERHEERLLAIANGPHRQYLERLAWNTRLCYWEGVGWKRKVDDEKLKLVAAVGATLAQQSKKGWERRTKEQGPPTRCAKCGAWQHRSDTERIKPYRSTRYMRFCAKCAEKVKEAKRIYAAMKRHR